MELSHDVCRGTSPADPPPAAIATSPLPESALFGSTAGSISGPPSPLPQVLGGINAIQDYGEDSDEETMEGVEENGPLA